MARIPTAVQLFTVREECEKNFAETLKQVAEIGYDGVELAGLHGLSAAEVKALLDECGLRAAASHVSLEAIQYRLDEVIAEQKLLGSRYIVCPYLEPAQRTEAHYRALVHVLTEAGEACKKEGITLCYHNHDFELAALSDGKSALASLFDETKPDVLAAELDVYWLAKAGEQPARWIEKYKGRTPLIHLKDMTKDEQGFFAELGTGSIDFDAILTAAAASNVEWWVVEQDETKRPPLESIQISLNYWKSKTGN